MNLKTWMWNSKFFPKKTDQLFCIKKDSNKPNAIEHPVHFLQHIYTTYTIPVSIETQHIIRYDRRNEKHKEKYFPNGKRQTCIYDDILYYYYSLV